MNPVVAAILLLQRWRRKYYGFRPKAKLKRGKQTKKGLRSAEGRVVLKAKAAVETFEQVELGCLD